MIREIKIPEIGENVKSGVVVAVHIRVDDTIDVDDTIIELETDKALVEIPSPFAGKVTQILAEAGSEMKVGEVIARVDLASENESTTETGSDETKAEPEKEAKREAPPSTFSDNEEGGKKKSDLSTPDTGSETQTPPDNKPVPASPSIRRLAREFGVNLNGVTGTGSGGRITEEDVRSHVRERLEAEPQGGVQAPPLPDFTQYGDVEIMEMGMVRRLTAQRTATSWETIPHVTQFDEADVTDVLSFIEKYGKRAENAGAKMTVMTIVTCMCTRALRRFPKFNASIDTAGNRIIVKKYIHIGIAVDTPRGLLAPVIRDADQKSIVELAVSIADLAWRARSKKIKPDEMKGGTFSISNQGGIGGVGFTPIVLWPQVATLGMSRTAVKPVYMNDGFQPRTILPLSLSYDHRIIDGADAARFLRWICDGLEDPMTLFLE